MSKYIKKALDLAQKANPYPNPQVGAILVKDGKIIGQGMHKKFGGPHAEVEAFHNCKTDPKGATLYVTLEPCSRYGKTPPCTDLIIKKGIEKVICGRRDPSQEGAKKLRKAGIKTRILLPHITLKIASSIDFKIWSPTCTKITGKTSQKYVHKLRAKADAILVGINTILTDNPQLNVRLSQGPNPTKIVLDSKLRIPLKAKILQEGEVIICTTVKSSQKRTHLEKLGTKILTYPNLHNLKPVLTRLTSLSYEKILVEGGQQISSSFLRENLANEVLLFISDKKLGKTGLEAIMPSSLQHLKITKTSKIGKDTLITMSH